MGPGLSAYQTSKLALVRFTDFINAEYGENGAVAFCIHPGNIPGTDILGPGGESTFQVVVRISISRVYFEDKYED